MTEPYICATDRWTCPHLGCGRTVVVSATPGDVRAALRACQERHARGHAATRPMRAIPNQRRKEA